MRAEGPRPLRDRIRCDSRRTEAPDDRAPSPSGDILRPPGVERRRFVRADSAEPVKPAGRGRGEPAVITPSRPARNSAVGGDGQRERAEVGDVSLRDRVFPRDAKVPPAFRTRIEDLLKAPVAEEQVPRYSAGKPSSL